MILRIIFGFLLLALPTFAAEPLTRQALIDIANAKPGEKPTIKELEVLPFAARWEERTIWTYFDGDEEKEKYLGGDHWSADGRFHVSRVTHVNGVLQLEEEQSINLITYDAEQKMFMAYLVYPDDLIVAEGIYAAAKKTLTIEGKSTDSNTAILCTMQIKDGNKSASNVDLYVDGERLATARSRSGPINEAK
ncbi:MAG: hypothetical protein ACI9TH_002154 [Kiritimatiellia bacterium]|jgi:hypothetical protein